MRLPVSFCVFARSLLATAAPFIVSDPVVVGVSQCGAYIDSEPKVTSPVIGTAGGNICRYDVAGVSAGAHSVTMTTITVNDPIWGSQESAMSSPLALTVPGALTGNYQGLWWNSPAGSESGWGINLTHQGDRIFATWFTYDTTGKEWWLAMSAPSTAMNTFSGVLYQTRGPPFDAAPFNPADVTVIPVGLGTLTFSDTDNGTFAYTVDGISQTKAITREAFGPVPACTFEAQPDFVLATNFQDLWWAAPAASESGWGINLTNQGDTIFATWFTYDRDGTPLWLSVTAPRTEPGTYSGALYRTTGPAFNAVPFNPAGVIRTAVGTATFRFSDGNSATFTYTVNTGSGPITQSKQIKREAFGSPRSLCQ